MAAETSMFLPCCSQNVRPLAGRHVRFLFSDRHTLHFMLYLHGYTSLRIMIEQNTVTVNKLLMLMSVWRVYTEHCTALTLNDINNLNEDITLKLLNVAYDWGLKNLNEDKKNYPAIDLGNKSKQIGVSVTATRTADYIHSKIETNITNEVYKTFPQHYFYITTNPVNHTATFDTKGLYTFEKEKHIMDSFTLSEKLKSLTEDKQKEAIKILEDYVVKFKFDFVEDLTPNDIAEILKEFTKQNPQLISDVTPEIAKIQRTSFSDKNALNNLSEGYIKLIQQSSLPFFEQLNSFLSKAENQEIKDMYLNIVGDLQKVILVKRSNYIFFDDFFTIIEETCKIKFPELAKNRRKLQILLHFMYFQCDIGENKA